MHSALLHPLGIYMVVFSIPRLLNPDTRQQVGLVDAHVLVISIPYKCAPRMTICVGLTVICAPNIQACRKGRCILYTNVTSPHLLYTESEALRALVEQHLRARSGGQPAICRHP